MSPKIITRRAGFSFVEAWCRRSSSRSCKARLGDYCSVGDRQNSRMRAKTPPVQDPRHPSPRPGVALFPGAAKDKRRFHHDVVLLAVQSGVPFCFLSSRSEEHTSELQSHSDLVCRLLLEKKKKKRIALLLQHDKHTSLQLSI